MCLTISPTVLRRRLSPFQKFGSEGQPSKEAAGDGEQSCRNGGAHSKNCSRSGQIGANYINVSQIARLGCGEGAQSPCTLYRTAIDDHVRRIGPPGPQLNRSLPETRCRSHNHIRELIAWVVGGGGYNSELNVLHIDIASRPPHSPYAGLLG